MRHGALPPADFHVDAGHQEIDSHHAYLSSLNVCGLLKPALQCCNRDRPVSPCFALPFSHT